MQSRFEEKIKNELIKLSNLNDFKIYFLGLDDMDKEISKEIQIILKNIFNFNKLDYFKFYEILKELYTSNIFGEDNKCEFFLFEKEFYNNSSNNFLLKNFHSNEKNSIKEKLYIKMNPVKIIENNNTHYYYGDWNLKGEKNGFGIMITKNKDLYFGTFDNNQINGIGIFLKEFSNRKIGNDLLIDNSHPTSNQKDNYSKVPENDIMEINLENTLGSQINKINNYDNNLSKSTSIMNEKSYLKYVSPKNDVISSNEGIIIKKCLNKNEKNNSYIINIFDSINNLERKNYESIQTKDIYIGEFKNSEICGFGNIILKNGESYFGKFLENKKNGYGKYVFSDGSIYEGEFFNDKFHGLGKYIFSDKSIYEGEFSNGYLEGEGEMRWNDGRVYRGQWKNNCLSGNGKNSWMNNHYYEGGYMDNKKNGKGKYRWRDDKLVEGNFLNNKFHGKNILSVNNSKIICTWKFGRLVSIVNS